MQESKAKRSNRYIIFFFRDRVSLCSSGCPGVSQSVLSTHSVEQAGLKLRKLPASASQVLGLKACATTNLLLSLFLYQIHWYIEPSPCQ